MPKNDNIDEKEYQAFFKEIKGKIDDFQALLGNEALDFEKISDEYERLCFNNNDMPEELSEKSFTKK